MARSRNRKKAPKAAPRITVMEGGKPVEVRADGSEPRQRRIKITSDTATTQSNATRHVVAKTRGETKEETAARVESRRQAIKKGTQPAPPKGSVAEGILAGTIKEGIPVDVVTKEEVPSAQDVLEEENIRKNSSAQSRNRGQAEVTKGLKELPMSRQLRIAKDMKEMGLDNPKPLSPQEEAAARKEQARRKSMRVDQNIKAGLNTAIVPEAGTPSGQRPAAPYLGDGGHGGTIKIGRGAGAPLAPRAKGQTRRELRSKENIKIARNRASNKIPKLGAGNLDYNASIIAGERPHEQLVREQKRGMGGKRFTEMLAGGKQDSGMSYADTTDVRRLSAARTSIGGTSSDEDLARHIAKSSSAGYLKPGSIDPVQLPGKMTDQAKLARTAFFGQQARQTDIDTKVRAATQSNKASARRAGHEINPNLSDEKAEQLGATSGKHEGLYGTGKDVKSAIALRDRYVRKYGHKLSDEGMRNLPGVSREEAMELTPHADIERKSKTLSYYLGQNSGGDTVYNKGLEKSKIAEIAHHTNHKASHVAAWVKSTGVDVHSLHKDLSEQVYDGGVAKKAWVPTDNPGQTHRMVEFHPSGRVKSRRGRDASGANLPRRFVPIQTNPGSDAGTLTHAQYIGHKVSEFLETKPFRQRAKRSNAEGSSLTAGVTGGSGKRTEVQTPFGSSEDIIRRSGGPTAEVITQEGKALGRGRSY